MPSIALINWQTDRMPRLGHIDAHCVALAAIAPATAPPTPGPLVEESLQGYVMLLSGHFQGFCRDLYTECAQILTNAAAANLQRAVQLQCITGLALNIGNPTIENIRKDFERFDFILDLPNADPGNQQRMTHLGHLNFWRNQVAHQKTTPAPAGIPSVLVLGDIRSWRASCDGLAASLDDIMRVELTLLVGAAPW